MIRYALAWQIEAACLAQDFNTAVSLTVLATKLAGSAIEIAVARCGP